MVIVYIFYIIIKSKILFQLLIFYLLLALLSYYNMDVFISNFKLSNVTSECDGVNNCENGFKMISTYYNNPYTSNISITNSTFESINGGSNILKLSVFIYNKYYRLISKL